MLSTVIPRPAAALALASLLAALSPIACGPKPADHASAQQSLSKAAVQVVKTSLERQPRIEEITGSVKARTSAVLEAKIMGRIANMTATPGQPVRKGDVLARLEAPEVQARLDQTQAQLSQAESDWRRTTGLFEQKVLTSAERDGVEARLRMARAAHAEAQAMTAYLEVRSPFDGVLVRKLANTGDLAAPGKPLLSVDDTGILQFEADVPEALASKVVVGTALTVSIGAPTQSFPATVSELEPSADTASRTFRIKLDLPKGAPLIPGQFGRVQVTTGEDSVLAVPASALVQRGQLEIVFVAREQKAHMRLVKTGRQLGSNIELLAGVDAGEEVVIQNAASLTDGQPVEVR